MTTLGTTCIRWALLALAFLTAAAGVAIAGMDVSLEREFQRLEDIQRRVEGFPAYRESEDLEQQIFALREKFEELAEQDPKEIGADRESLRKQIDTLQRQLNGLGKMIVDFREQLSVGGRGRFFPGVHHRIAAFTFNDPHQTGLGDPVSFLLSKKLLFSTRVSSFAIVNYRNGTDRDTSSKLAYFDRVDAITDDQGFLLALWGSVSRTDNGVRIDSFLQVPADVDGTPYVRRIRLPEAMGGGMLTARLKPDRILLQRVEVGPDRIGALREAAAEVATLRAEPSISAAAIGRLVEDRPYRIVDSHSDWVQLSFDGVAGWTSVDAFCTGVCRELLDAAIYTNDAVALTSGLSARPVPRSLTREAVAVSEQLAGLVALADNPRRAVEIAEPWAAGLRISPPPGGAGFANLLAVAQIAAELELNSAEEPNFDRIRLDRDAVAKIANGLAEASVADPGDVDVLENLAMLFTYLGDDRRRGLALEIVASLRAR